MAFSIGIGYWKDGCARTLKEAAPAGPVRADNGEVAVTVRLFPDGPGVWRYELTYESAIDTAVIVWIKPDFAGQNLIPANIFGDNRLEYDTPPTYPHLTDKERGTLLSPLWAYRADRAPVPMSAVLGKTRACGITAEPYTDGRVNGVLAAIGHCGVSAGYRNYPVTFDYRDRCFSPTEDMKKRGTLGGLVFDGARGLEQTVIRRVYEVYGGRPKPDRSPSEYGDALYSALRACHIDGAFYDVRFAPDGTFTPFRRSPEIAWTAGANLYYPLFEAARRRGDAETAGLCRQWFDRLCGLINPASGLFFDVDDGEGVASGWGAQKSAVNGWWAGLVVDNEHSAYTVGEAAWYLLSAAAAESNATWTAAACKVLDTICDLQRADGNLGYAYAVNEKRVTKWRGFAGCWFAAALAKGYEQTGRRRYLEAAARAMDYYRPYVSRYAAYGTPMDTQWSPDSEGNIAFMKAAALLHRCTGETRYADMLAESAAYEYLWRYCYTTRPVCPPLAGRFDSCGGTVTSVSNPHIHPMGCLICGELCYLSDITSDEYHRRRAGDGLACFLRAADVWADCVAGGRLGFLSERYCPSDGLLLERYPDGSPSSTWFNANTWAIAAVLEGWLQYDGLRD